MSMIMKYAAFALAASLSFIAGQELSLPDGVLENWHNFTLFEKVPYLLSPEDAKNKRQEFEGYGASGGEDCITFEAFLNKLSEFQQDSVIALFWEYCDANKDGGVCLDEYFYCRGEFEQNGNRYDFNEYEFLEKLSMEEFEEKLNELKERKTLQEYEYDENGIIID